MKRAFALLLAVLFTVLPLWQDASRADSTSTGQTSAATANTPTGSAPGNQEVVGLRTRTSRTYETPTGAYVAHVYPGSINYQDAQGTWQPIDNTLVPATATGYAYQNRANRYTVSFPADLSSGPIRVQTPSGWVQFTLSGGSGTGTISGSTDTYPLSGASMAFTADNDQLKETTTLQSASAPSTFTWTIQTSAGLTARQNASGGIDFVNSAGVSQFGFAPPFMQDQAGAVSQAVSLRLALGAAGQTLTVSADSTWLADPGRQYPVVIDPTVTFLTPSQDCFITNGNDAGYSYCPDGYLYTGNNSHVNRTLLQFDLSSIPSNAQISEAQLGLNVFQHPDTAMTVEAHQVTHSWTTQVSWNAYDGTNPWTTPGGDYSSTVAATTTVGTGTGVGWYYWYPTQLVQGWVNGTIPNDGILLKDQDETNAAFFFEAYSTRLQADTWPFLQITYSPQTGTTGSSTFVGEQLTDHMDLGVNVANGNLLLHEGDIAMPGVGLPLTVDRFYNNLLPSGSVTDLGNKWRLGLGSPDVGLSFLADGSAVFTAPSGSQYVFHKNSSGTFRSPPGIDADLVLMSDGTYTLTEHQSRAVWDFSSSGTLTALVDQSGNKLTFVYSGSKLSSITDTLGHSTTFTYNAANLISQITDPAGRVYKYGYDSSNNLTSYTDPANKVVQFGYTNGNLTQITDPNNNSTTLGYDTSGRVTSITQATETTSFTYNTGTTVVTDPNSHAWTYAYDGAGRVTSVTSPLGHTTTTAWTSDNQVSQVTAPSGATTSLSYDGSNNLTKVVTPTGATASWAYANSSMPYLPTSATDTQGNTSTFLYNGQGLLTSSTDATSSTQSATYNSNGTVASSTDGNNNTTTYSYAANGFPSQDTPPSPLGTTKYTFNSYNLEATVTDGKGQLTQFTYDVLGRVTGIAYADGTSIGYSYDADGNVLSMADSTGTTTYTYNSLNELTKKTLPTGQTVSYTYDGVGNLLTKTDSSGTTTYTYTKDDQPASVKDPSGNTSTVSYDQDGNETQLAFPTSVGVTENMSYDTAGQLLSITAKNSSNAVLNSYTYSYVNPSNNQQTTIPYSVTNASGTKTSYGYDGSNALTSASSPSNSYTFGYDYAGNLTSKAVNGTSTTLTYNAANQLTQASGGSNKTYSYDANGDLTAVSDGTRIAVNAAGQITSVTPPNSSATNMSYTGVGEQERVVAGSTTYQYDATGLSSQNDGTTTTNFTSLPDGTLISEKVGSSTYYYLGDGAGNVAGLVDSTGALKNTYTYDPLGNATTSGTAPNPFTFQGWMYDSHSGFYYTGSGYYDPVTGQSFGCHDKGRYDPGEDLCGKDEPGERGAFTEFANCNEGMFSPMSSGQCGGGGGGDIGEGDGVDGGEDQTSEPWRGESGRQRYIPPARSPVWRGLRSYRGSIKTDCIDLFSYDRLHGEIEVFNKKGRHLGAIDPVTGDWIKGPVAGRRIKP